MKKRGIALRSCGIALLAIGFFLLMFAHMLFYPIDTASDYSDLALYERADGIVREWTQFDDGEIYLSLDWESEEWYDGCFLCPANAEIALANGFAQEIKQGSEITVRVCPRIFYDGGRCPVIAVTAGGKEYLSAGQALDKQAEWSRDRDEWGKRQYWTIMIPTLAVVGCGTLLTVLGCVFSAKAKSGRKAENLQEYNKNNRKS